MFRVQAGVQCCTGVLVAYPTQARLAGRRSSSFGGARASSGNSAAVLELVRDVRTVVLGVGVLLLGFLS